MPSGIFTVVGITHGDKPILEVVEDGKPKSYIMFPNGSVELHYATRLRPVCKRRVFSASPRARALHAELAKLQAKSR